MGAKIIALYQDWTQADAVVGQLLDIGLPPSNVELKSGHYWLDAIAETDSQAIRPVFHLEGGEVVVEVNIPSEELTAFFQTQLFKSSPLGLQIQDGNRRETWVSIPVTVAYIEAMRLYR